MKSINLRITKNIFYFSAIALLGLSSCGNGESKTTETSSEKATTTAIDKSLQGKWGLVYVSDKYGNDSISSTSIDYKVKTIFAFGTVSTDYPNDPETVTETFMICSTKGDQLIITTSDNPANLDSYTATFSVTDSTLTIGEASIGISEYKKL